MRRSKIILHGYRQLYSIHKNRKHLQNIAKDVETKFDTSTYKLERPLPRRKNKKFFGLMKDELGG